MRTQFFSDTLIVSVDDACNDLGLLLEFSRKLLELGIENRFPIRGGIAHGPIVWDDTITFGRAVVEAHRIEQESDWIGISCTSKCPRVDSLFSWDLVVTYPVPKKIGPVQLVPAVAWTIPSANKLNDNTLLGLKVGECIRWDSQQTKVVNTLLFAKYLQHVNQQNAPQTFNYGSPAHFLGMLGSH